MRGRRALLVDEPTIVGRAREEAARALSRTDLTGYGRGTDKWRGSVNWPSP